MNLHEEVAGFCDACDCVVYASELARGEGVRRVDGLSCSSCRHPDQAARMGPFAIQGTFGSGRLSVVHQARDSRNGRIVALKVFRPEVTSRRRARQRFVAELETLQCLDHRNIIRILGAGEVDRRLYIAMEAVDGKDLRSVVAKKGRLPLKVALSIGRKLCRALEHAHSRGILHGDVKPSNVLYLRTRTIKLSDFAICRSFSPDPIGPRSRCGDALGTLEYMAPEQLNGTGVADERTDLYALGATLYHMVTGRPPFSGFGPMDLVRQIGNDLPATVGELRPDTPTETATLIDGLLSKDPDERPGPASRIVDGLE